MTSPELRRLLGNIAPVIRSFVEKKTGDIDAKVVALEVRIAELEARPVGLTYAGTWQSGETYARDVGVTHRGSLWVAKTHHARSEPGEDPVCWQLVAKRGRDARDAR